MAGFTWNDRIEQNLKPLWIENPFENDYPALIVTLKNPDDFQLLQDYIDADYGLEADDTFVYAPKTYPSVEVIYFDYSNAYSLDYDPFVKIIKESARDVLAYEKGE